MIQTHMNSSSYGYGISSPQASEETKLKSPSSTKRETYGTALLERFDDKAYQAFVNSTASLSQADKSLAAKTLERTAAISAANAYALNHDVNMSKDLATVYNYFENYQGVVTGDQIKHILNSKLQTSVSVEGQRFESEQFFQDFTAQLGGSRTLDIRV